MSSPATEAVLFFPVLPGVELRRVAEAGRLVTCPGPKAIAGLPEEERERIAVLVTNAGLGCDATVIGLLPRLRHVVSLGAGLDKLDRPAMAARGITLRSIGEALTDDVADLAMALALMAARGLVQADAYVRSGGWAAAKVRRKPGISLSGATMGIAGLGRIGQAIAARAQAARMRVLGLARPSAQGLGIELLPDMRALAAASDVLVLVLPGGAGLRHVVGAAELEALGPDGILVNVGRGELVDTEALIEALEKGTIAAAGLDVLEGEPVVPPRLAALPNVILTPHIGGATLGARTRGAAIADAEAMAALGLG